MATGTLKKFICWLIFFFHSATLNRMLSSWVILIVVGIAETVVHPTGRTSHPAARRGSVSPSSPSSTREWPLQASDDARIRPSGKCSAHFSQFPTSTRDSQRSQGLWFGRIHTQGPWVGQLSEGRQWHRAAAEETGAADAGGATETGSVAYILAVFPCNLIPAGSGNRHWCGGSVIVGTGLVSCKWVNSYT